MDGIMGERKPLILNKDASSIHNIGGQGRARWQALVSAIGGFLLQYFSYLLSFYVMNQYSYYAYFKQIYPNTSFNSGESSSDCGNNTNTTQYKEQIVVQKLTAEWNIYCTLVSNIPGILFVMNSASLSDVYGRKLFLITPLFGTLFKNVLCAIGIYFSININLFIIFYAIEGCTGSWISSLSIVYCYIADVTEAGKPRSLIIGVLEGSLGIGAILSSTATGYLINWTHGYFYPEVTSVSTIAMAILLVILLMPESLPVTKRRKKVPFLQNMARVTECVRSNFSPIAKQWVFIILISIFIMSSFANLGRLQIDTLYQLNDPFYWDSVRIGWYGTLKIGMNSIGGMVMIKLFHFCTSDEYIALAGCVTTVASCILTGFASNDLMIYLSAVVGIGSTVTLPMVRAIMSRLAPAHKQGSVFSGVAVVEIVCNLGSSLGANAVYGATVAIYRGFTFFIMAGYDVVGIILCFVLIMGQPKQNHYHKVKDIRPEEDHNV